jgi:hypothetical protein
VDDEAGFPLDSEAVADLLAGAAERRREPAQRDSVEDLEARLAELPAAVAEAA